MYKRQRGRRPSAGGGQLLLHILFILGNGGVELVHQGLLPRAPYEKDMEEQLAAAGGGPASSSAVFAVVTVKAGPKLLGGVGCEFLLRSGSAVCVAASAPGLIDSTDGATLASGGARQPNHLYLSTAEGRGLQAGSDATVLVRGSYQIS